MDTPFDVMKHIDQPRLDSFQGDFIQIIFVGKAVNHGTDVIAFDVY